MNAPPLVRRIRDVLEKIRRAGTRRILVPAAIAALIVAAFLATIPVLFGHAEASLEAGVFGLGFLFFLPVFAVLEAIWTLISRRLQIAITLLLFVLGVVSGALVFVALGALVLTILGNRTKANAQELKKEKGAT